MFPSEKYLRFDRRAELPPCCLSSAFFGHILVADPEGSVKRNLIAICRLALTRLISTGSVRLRESYHGKRSCSGFSHCFRMKQCSFLYPFFLCLASVRMGRSPKNFFLVCLLSLHLAVGFNHPGSVLNVQTRLEQPEIVCRPLLERGLQDTSLWWRKSDGSNQRHGYGMEPRAGDA